MNDFIQYSDDTTINIMINSKNIRNIDQNPNNVLLNIDQSLIKCHPRTQYLEMNVISFVMKNSFYSTQESNNKFHIIYKDLSYNILKTEVYSIAEGNYNVFEMLDELQNLLINVASVTYNSVTNKFTFKREYIDENEYIYIKSDSAQNFIGFENGIEYLVDIATTSIIVLNMAGHSTILLEIPNIQTRPNILDNINSDGIVQPSAILCFITIDVPSFGLLKYENLDAGNSFSYVLEEKEINSLNIIIRDQDKQIINVSDYQLCLQFIIRNKGTSTNLTLLKSIDTSLKTIIHLVGDLWTKFTKKG